MHSKCQMTKQEILNYNKDNAGEAARTVAILFILCGPKNISETSESVKWLNLVTSAIHPKVCSLVNLPLCDWLLLKITSTGRFNC